METKTEEQPIEVRVFDNVVLQGADGRILVNGPQQDLMVIRHRYADGTVALFTRRLRDGEVKPFGTRYNPKDQGPRCPHCHKEL